jgi:hypothetical protein
MSSSDARMFADLVARVAKLETRAGDTESEVHELAERVFGKDLADELYGPQMDHSMDRADRAALLKRAIPGRPTGPRAA